MSDKVKRLKPRPETLRELFLKSGNLCAFPGCRALMMNEDGIFIGQLCHIEAAEEGGQRFNAAMSNEDRRHAANLMLMCYEHHRATDDTGTYGVARLRKIKQDHERRYSRPDRAILKTLTDWTTTEHPTPVTSLRRLNEVMEWNHSDGELQESADELNAYIEDLRRVPIDVRRFVGAVARRMHRMEGTRAVRSDMTGGNLLLDDFRSSHEIPHSTIRKNLAQLSSYGLGGIDEIDTDVGPMPAVRLTTLASGWPLWADVARFCELTHTALESFTDELDFSSFDSIDAP